MFAAANQAHFNPSLFPGISQRLQGPVLEGVEHISPAYHFQLSWSGERPDLDIDRLLHNRPFFPALQARARDQRPENPTRVAQGDGRQAPDALPYRPGPRTVTWANTAQPAHLPALTVPQIIARATQRSRHQADAYRFSLNTD